MTVELGVSGKAKIAIMNTSEEITNLLERVLTDEGFETVTIYTLEVKTMERDFNDFVKTNKPSVILYDISIPYDENYLLLKNLQALKITKNIPFVVTTTNKKALENIVGDSHAFELIGKPYDLDEIVGAIKSALLRVGSKAAL